MKTKDRATQRSCALCVHASLIPCDGTEEAPPLLFSLTADGMDEEKVRIVCPYKRTASPSLFCRRFSFDPLKYRPKKAPPLGTLDKDDLLID